MIDPRALQQHFKQIREKELPPVIDVPRVPDTEPLTGVKAIPEPKEEVVVDKTPEIFDSLKQEVNLVIDVPPPIDSIIIDEIEEEGDIPVVDNNEEKAEVKDDNPYGYSTSSKEETSYDPYGYYSGN